ncbi:MAG: hypothetical protein CVU85_07570 [Firmicutes bacterium HGW-Firmicutes-10]|jgi:hypothetical protein|nr:MAG: hypothetical protein CVU85_07570 [Firmicutes bacterium HGW-Firmicutes-10]
MRSVDWLLEHGRPLDIARFRYHFENGNVSAVLNELKKFQNSDGGFGHGLEPDFRNPDSSPIASWVATEILSEIGCWNLELGIVRDLVDYLTNCQQKDGDWFRFAIESNNAHPRAIWWNYDPEKKAGIYNPSAALYGFLAMVTDDTKAKKKLETIFFHFMSDDDLDMHDLNSLVRAVQYAIMANIDIRNEVIEKAKQQILRGCQDFIEKDRTDYVLRPSVFFPNFHFPFFEDIIDALKIESNWLMETVNEDGIWQIPWNWYQFEDEFEKIKPDWMSDMIVRNLRLIHRMNKEARDVDV